MSGMSTQSEISKLCLLEAFGDVYMLQGKNQLEQLRSSMQMKKVAFASQNRDVLYGIGSDLKAYVWVSKPDVPIRQVVVIYENQRWTPTRGFSDSLLPTDRYSWSDESGRFYKTKDMPGLLPSDFWRFESNVWEIDESFDGQLLGPEGWTYAIDFPATYTPEKRWNSMVRRRRWLRSCRYYGTDLWASLAVGDPAEGDLSFIDISAGGCDVAFPDGHSQLLVWAVSTDGDIFIRTLSNRSSAYHGSSWMMVDLPEKVEVSQVSCSPAEGVWAVTTTGWALVRTGISRDNQYGTGWTMVEPPRNGAVLLSQVAVGPTSVWALGKGGSVWFRQGVKKGVPAGVAWVDIEWTGCSAITVSRNGEVFALGIEDRQVHWRTGVSLAEPHGRKWRMMGIKAPGQSPGKPARVLNWSCINATAGFLDPRSSSWEETEEWKEDIVDQLSQRFDKEMKNFTSLPCSVERDDWNAIADLRVWSARHSEWEDCTIEIASSDSEHSEQTKFLIDSKNSKDPILMSELTAVQLHEHPAGMQELWVYTAVRAGTQSPLRLTGSRSVVEQWYTILSECFREVNGVKELRKEGTVWVLSSTGCPSVSCGELSSKNPLEGVKWVTLTGHLDKLESASGITWALGYDRSIWIWTGSYQGKSGTEKRVQNDTHMVETYENQRWNPVGGFTSHLLLPTDRYAWSDESGRIQLTKEGFNLPSAAWKWDTDWQIDYDNADKKGWRYAFDFPFAYHPYKAINDCVRRRRWFRTMKVELAAPWLPGPATKLKTLSICPGVMSGDIIPVWGVMMDGSVVLRDRVTTDSPQGDTWIAVKGPTAFVDVSVGPHCVWVAAVDGTAYVRNGTKEKMDGLYWFQVEMPPNGANIVQVSVGHSAVWALCHDHTLWFRKDYSASFPEGTEWVYVSDDVFQISANAADQLYAIVLSPESGSMKTLARRTGVIPGSTIVSNMVGNGWDFGMLAECVSSRGIVGET